MTGLVLLFGGPHGTPWSPWGALAGARWVVVWVVLLAMFALARRSRRHGRSAPG